MASKGLFITFEGIEASGKTTHLRLLEEHLRLLDYATIITHEPGGTQISEELRSILLDVDNYALTPTTELLLYAASRAQHVSQVIKPALEAQKIVISDRFTDSTIAYQGYGRKLELKKIEMLNSMATDGVMPLLTFLLDLPVEATIERLKERGESLDRLERETIEFYKRVRSGYLELARNNSERIVVIPSEGEKDEVFHKIKSETDRWLKKLDC